MVEELVGIWAVRRTKQWAKFGRIENPKFFVGKAENSMEERENKGKWENSEWILWGEWEWISE